MLLRMAKISMLHIYINFTMNGHFKHNVWLLCTLFFFGLSIAITFPAPRPRYGGVLRHGIFQKPINFDPVDVLNFAELQIASAIFEGLVKYDVNGRIVPAVASEWDTSKDGRMWAFIVAKEAKFHNGRIVTASDVKLSLQRTIKKIRLKSGFLSLVDEISVINEHTLRINLTEGEPDFLGQLMLPQAWIVPVDDVDKESFRTNPIGTGPFKMLEQGPSETKLAANDEYPWGKPFLKELIFKYYDNLQAARFDFESGGLDSFHIPVADAVAMQEEQSGQLFREEPAESVYLQLNPKPFKNEQWQDVLKYAIDVQSILSYQYGLSEARYLYEGSSVLLKNRSLYNPTKARRMLKSSGWQSDKKLKFIAANLSDNTGNAVAVRIQRMLSSTGMSTAILHFEQAEFKKAVRNGNFDLVLLSAPLLCGNLVYLPQPTFRLYQLPSYILRQPDIYGVNAMLGGVIQFENVWLKRRY